MDKRKTEQKMVKISTFILSMCIFIAYFAVVALAQNACTCDGEVFYNNGTNASRNLNVTIKYYYANNSPILPGPPDNGVEYTYTGFQFPFPSDGHKYKDTTPADCASTSDYCIVTAWDVNLSAASPTYKGTNTTTFSTGYAQYLNVTLTDLAEPNISFSSDKYQDYGLQNQNVTYILNITNNAGGNDNINLTVSSNATSVVFNESFPMTVANGTSRYIIMNISSSGLGNFTTNLTAYSLFNTSVHKNVTIYTIFTAAPVRGVVVNANQTNSTIFADGNTTYIINVTNLGNNPDNFTLTNLSNAPNAWLNETNVLELAPLASYFIELYVWGTIAGTYSTNVTAVSDNDGSATSTVEINTTIIAIEYNVTIVSNETQPVNVYNTTNATYLLNVTNIGNRISNYSLENSTNASIVLLNQTLIEDLGPGEWRLVEIDVGDDLDGMYETNITVFSDWDDNFNATVTVYTNVTELYRQIGITAAPPDQTFNNDTTASYDIYVTNTGTINDTFILTNQTNTSSALLNQTTIINIGPGETRQAILYVSDPVPGTYQTNVTAVSAIDGSVTNLTITNSTILEAPIRDVNVTANVTFIDIYNTSVASYLLNITNAGNQIDNFTISLTSGAVTVLNTTSTGNISPGLSVQVILNVSNPTLGLFDTNVNVTSINDGDAWDNITVFTNVSEVPYQGLLIHSNPTARSVEPGKNATYTINITNTGNYPDNFTLFVDVGTSNATSAVLNQTQTPYMNAGESFFVILNVSDPSPGNYSTNVTAISQENVSVNASVIVTTQVVPNQAPSQPTIDLVPDTPTADEDLNCTVTVASIDPEAQPVSYYYEWYKNGMFNMSTENISTTYHVLLAGNTTKNEVWNCTVTPTDGSINGTSSSDVVTIANTAPTIDVNITPENASTIQNLTCSGIYYDVNGDVPSPVSYQFSGDYADAGNANCLALSATMWNCTANVTSDNTTAGDSITCQMTPNDGTTAGSSDSDSLTIASVDQPLNLGIYMNVTDLESVILNWTPSADASYYEIYWSSNETEMREHDPYYDNTPDATTTNTNYTDMTAGQVKERYYRVAAVKLPAYKQAPETVGKKNISVEQGQNLISLPVQPSTDQLDDLIVPPPTSTYDRIVRYDPGTGFQRTDYYGPTWKWWGYFDTIELDRGYYFYPTKQAYVIPVAGKSLDVNRSVTISAGRNLIGWSSVHTKTMDSVLTPPTDEDRVTRYTPNQGWERTDYYSGYGWYGKFTEFEPGKGYWFYPTGTGYTWKYDPK